MKILCIQEYKLEVVNLKICKEVWGDSKVEWRTVPEINSVGEIIMIWGK